MTNKDKFIEIFGSDLKQNASTISWWDQEYISNKEQKTEQGLRVDRGWVEYTCEGSNCGCLNYCPNCGANMEVKE